MMFKDRILVVDDESGVRESFNQILQDKYTVDMASSGEEAVEKVKRAIPDLVFLDYILPGDNGPEILKKIHKINRCLPVIMVTKVDTIRAAVESMKLGAYDYINKPFDVNQILTLVKTALIERDRRMERSLQATTFFNLVSEITSGADMKSLLSHLLNVSTQLIIADSGSIMLINNGGISIEVAKGLDNEVIKTTIRKIGEGIAGWVVKERKPLLIINGLKNDARFSHFKGREGIQSSLCVPIKIEDRVIGVLNLNRITFACNFTEADLELATMLTNQVAMVIENVRLQKDREAAALEVIMSLAEAVDAKDHYTHAHSEKVMKYAVLIAEKMNLPKKEIGNIKRAALLHDIGKIGIKDGILNKPGKLTLEEWKEVKEHPFIGREILKPLKVLKGILPIVYHHHERYDGQGYLGKLKGEQIPLGSRILALADTFDAMSSARPYRNACPRDQILAEIKAGIGTHFDPKVVDAFLSILDKKGDLWWQI